MSGANYRRPMDRMTNVRLFTSDELYRGSTVSTSDTYPRVYVERHAPDSVTSHFVRDEPRSKVSRVDFDSGYYPYNSGNYNGSNKTLPVALHDESKTQYDTSRSKSLHYHPDYSLEDHTLQKRSILREPNVTESRHRAHASIQNHPPVSSNRTARVLEKYRPTDDKNTVKSSKISAKSKDGAPYAKWECDDDIYLRMDKVPSRDYDDFVARKQHSVSASQYYDNQYLTSSIRNRNEAGDGRRSSDLAKSDISVKSGGTYDLDEVADNRITERFTNEDKKKLTKKKSSKFFNKLKNSDKGLVGGISRIRRIIENQREELGLSEVSSSHDYKSNTMRPRSETRTEPELKSLTDSSFYGQKNYSEQIKFDGYKEPLGRGTRAVSNLVPSHAENNAVRTSRDYAHDRYNDTYDILSDIASTKSSAGVPDLEKEFPVTKRTYHNAADVVKVNTNIIKKKPKEIPRKVASGPSAPVYKGFSEVDGYSSSVTARPLPPAPSVPLAAVTSKISSAKPGSTVQSHAGQYSGASSSVIHGGKVLTATDNIPVSERNAKPIQNKKDSVITTASWREGLKVINEELGHSKPITSNPAASSDVKKSTNSSSATKKSVKTISGCDKKSTSRQNYEAKPTSNVKNQSEDQYITADELNERSVGHQDLISGSVFPVTSHDIPSETVRQNGNVYYDEQGNADAMMDLDVDREEFANVRKSTSKTEKQKDIVKPDDMVLPMQSIDVETNALMPADEDRGTHIYDFSTPNERIAHQPSIDDSDVVNLLEFSNDVSLVTESIGKVKPDTKFKLTGEKRTYTAALSSTKQSKNMNSPYQNNEKKRAESVKAPVVHTSSYITEEERLAAREYIKQQEIVRKNREKDAREELIRAKEAKKRNLEELYERQRSLNVRSGVTKSTQKSATESSDSKNRVKNDKSKDFAQMSSSKQPTNSTRAGNEVLLSDGSLLVENERLLSKSGVLSNSANNGDGNDSVYRRSEDKFYSIVNVPGPARHDHGGGMQEKMARYDHGGSMQEKTASEQRYKGPGYPQHDNKVRKETVDDVYKSSQNQKLQPHVNTDKHSEITSSSKQNNVLSTKENKSLVGNERKAETFSYRLLALKELADSLPAKITKTERDILPSTRYPKPFSSLQDRYKDVDKLTQSDDIDIELISPLRNDISVSSEVSVAESNITMTRGSRHLELDEPVGFRPVDLTVNGTLKTSQVDVKKNDQDSANHANDTRSRISGSKKPGSAFDSALPLKDVNEISTVKESPVDTSNGLVKPSSKDPVLLAAEQKSTRRYSDITENLLSDGTSLTSQDHFKNRISQILLAVNMLSERIKPASNLIAKVPAAAAGGSVRQTNDQLTRERKECADSLSAVMQTSQTRRTEYVSSRQSENIPRDVVESGKESRRSSVADSDLERSLHYVLPSQGQCKKLRRDGSLKNLSEASNAGSIDEPTSRSERRRSAFGGKTFEQFSLDLVKSYYTEPETRVRHQHTELESRERALVDKLRTELMWADQKSRVMFNKAADDRHPLAARNPEIVRSTERQRAGLKILQEFAQQALELRQSSMIDDDNEIIESSALQLADKLRNAGVELNELTDVVMDMLTSHVSDNADSAHKQHKSVNQAVDYGSVGGDTGSVGGDSLSIGGESVASESASSPQVISDKLKRTLDKKYLTVREQGLRERRQKASDDLMAWKLRLDEDEREIIKLEQQAAEAKKLHGDKYSTQIRTAENSGFNFGGESAEVASNKGKLNHSSEDEKILRNSEGAISARYLTGAPGAESVDDSSTTLGTSALSSDENSMRSLSSASSKSSVSETSIEKTSAALKTKDDVLNVKEDANQLIDREESREEVKVLSEVESLDNEDKLPSQHDDYSANMIHDLSKHDIDETAVSKASSKSSSIGNKAQSVSKASSIGKVESVNKSSDSKADSVSNDYSLNNKADNIDKVSSDKKFDEKDQNNFAADVNISKKSDSDKVDTSKTSEAVSQKNERDDTHMSDNEGYSLTFDESSKSLSASNKTNHSKSSDSSFSYEPSEVKNKSDDRNKSYSDKTLSSGSTSRDSKSEKRKSIKESIYTEPKGSKIASRREEKSSEKTVTDESEAKEIETDEEISERLSEHSEKSGRDEKKETYQDKSDASDRNIDKRRVPGEIFGDKEHDKTENKKISEHDDVRKKIGLGDAAGSAGGGIMEEIVSEPSSNNSLLEMNRDSTLKLESTLDDIISKAAEDVELYTNKFVKIDKKSDLDKPGLSKGQQQKNVETRYSADMNREFKNVNTGRKIFSEDAESEQGYAAAAVAAQSLLTEAFVEMISIRRRKEEQLKSPKRRMSSGADSTAEGQGEVQSEHLKRMLRFVSVSDDDEKVEGSADNLISRILDYDDNVEPSVGKVKPTEDTGPLDLNKVLLTRGEGSGKLPSFMSESEEEKSGADETDEKRGRSLKLLTNQNREDKASTNEITDNNKAEKVLTNEMVDNIVQKVSTNQGADTERTSSSSSIVSAADDMYALEDWDWGSESPKHQPPASPPLSPNDTGKPISFNMDHFVALPAVRLSGEAAVQIPVKCYVPSTTEDIEPLVTRAVEILLEMKNNGESWENIDPSEHFLISLPGIENNEQEDDEKAITSRRQFNRMIFDLVAEILLDMFAEEDDSITALPISLRPPPRRAVFDCGGPRGRRQPPGDLTALTSVVQTHVQNCVRQIEVHEVSATEGLKRLNEGGGRKVRDAVDRMLMVELRRDEPEWVEYSRDALDVKNRVAETLLEMLLMDTVNVLCGLVC